MADSLPDLDTILKMWAWTSYITARGESQYEYEDIELRVLWDKVSCETKTPTYSNMKVNPDPPPVIVHTTTFQNPSDSSVEQKFQAQGETTSIATTTFTKGITRKSGFEMELPEELQTPIGKTMVLKEGETKDNQSWKTDTSITTVPHKTTLAKLVALQKSKEFDFLMEVRLKGTLRVNIMLAHTGSLLMVVQNDLATVLKDIIKADEGSAEYLNIVFEGKTVVWSLGGHVNFRYGAEVRVDVECEV